LRNQTSFLACGFQALLTTYVPHIVQTYGEKSVVIGGLKYGFSLRNVRTYNSGVYLSEAFRHGLSNRVPVTADFQLDVVPLLAVGKQEPEILSKVRSVVFYLPVCTGPSCLSSSALQDPEIDEQTLHAGILVCNGRMR